MQEIGVVRLAAGRVPVLCLILALFVSLSLATPGQPVSVDSSNNGAYCQSILDSCPFGQAVCVSTFCSATQRGGVSACDPQGICCTKDHAQSCLVGIGMQNPCYNVQNSIALCPTAPIASQASCLCAGNTNFDIQASRCGDLVKQGKYATVSSIIFGSQGALNYCSRNRQTAVATTGTARATTTIVTGSPTATPSASTGLPTFSLESTAATGLSGTTGLPTATGRSTSAARTSLPGATPLVGNSQTLPAPPASASGFFIAAQSSLSGQVAVMAFLAVVAIIMSAF